jgi:hypothetical protein
VVRQARQAVVEVFVSKYYVSMLAGVLGFNDSRRLEGERRQTPATCRHTADDINISARESVGVWEKSCRRMMPVWSRSGWALRR